MTMASQGALDSIRFAEARIKGLKGLAGVYHRRLKRVGLSAWLWRPAKILGGMQPRAASPIYHACFVSVP